MNVCEENNARKRFECIKGLEGEVDSSYVSEIVTVSRAEALSTGVVRRVGVDSPALVPISLFPLPFPAAALESAASVTRCVMAPALEHLATSLALGPRHNFALLCEVDPLLTELLAILDITYCDCSVGSMNDINPAAIMEASYCDACGRKLFLASIQAMIVRCDYMIEAETNAPKLVEFNTIACSYAGLSSYLRPRLAKTGQELAIKSECDMSSPIELSKQVLADPGKMVVSTMNDAIISYKSRFNCQENIVVLTIIADNDKGFGDHIALGKLLYTHFGIEMKFTTLTSLHEALLYGGARGGNDNYKQWLQDAAPFSENVSLYVTEKSTEFGIFSIFDYLKEETVKNCCTRVGLIYWRTGYNREDYNMNNDDNNSNDDNFFKTRAFLEYLDVVSIPSLATHIVGSKKMQETLLQPCAFHNLACSNRLRKSEDIGECNSCSKFREDYTNVNVPQCSADLYQNSELYGQDIVLKSQREGGGHTLFADEAKNLLEEKTPEQLKEFIVMKRIKPVAHRNALLHDDNEKPVWQDVVGELGVFFCAVKSAGNAEPFESSIAGCILRSKDANSNEGGICAGNGRLDLPLPIALALT